MAIATGRRIPDRYGEHDLAALIGLYESNYVRLTQLAPELDSLEGTVVSSVAGALDLYLTVEERFKYTTTISLTYRFEGYEEFEWLLEPNARICVYHDVRAAELLGHSRRRRLRRYSAWQRDRMPLLERKWEMNRFLFKWLRFCAYQGHLFLNCTASPGLLDEPAADRRSGRRRKSLE
ncbi:MAG: DUF1249 domain-containing protein [Gammaproteobacteria bacterium]|nr:DUF1249 domain-containing protein [Gammaproteobacteria bacterium]